MRPRPRTPSLLVALVLTVAFAGCTVDVEGAACSTPGDRTKCPDGQACGTGLTCSTRAAGCTPCVSGARACQAVEPGKVFACSAEADPACGTLAPVETCLATEQVCGGAVGGAACRCATFTVDPAAVSGTPCRFGAIQDAFEAAQALSDTEVLLGGTVGQVYGQATADSAGVAIPDGMTLRGADSPLAPGGRILLASGGAAGVRLGAGSALRGLTVRRAAGGPAVGIRVTGASPSGAASLDTVAVDAAGAGGAFSTGILVEGSGPVRLAGASVHGAAASGLEVSRLDGEQTVSLSGGLLQGNGVGARLLRGTLTVDGSAVFSSAAQGILAAPASGDVARLTVRNATVAHGASVGLEVQGLAALELQEAQVCANAGRTQTVAGVTRTAGGFLALGNVAQAPTIKACSFFGNGGDQVLIGGSTSAWSLDAGGCLGTGAAAPNVLTGYAPPGVGLAAIGANVNATNVSWSSSLVPGEGTDYLRGAGGSVTITSQSYCGVAAPVCPAAP